MDDPANRTSAAAVPLPDPLTISLPVPPPPAQPPLHPLIPTEVEQRRYRVGNAVLLATNNPEAFAPSAQDSSTHYPAERITTVCNNLDFADCWEAHILRPVADYLNSRHNGNPWSLSVFRSGFTVGWARQREYPLVVDVRFTGSQSSEAGWEEPTISEESALEVVSTVAGIISNHWQGEIVYVDICKTDLKFQRLHDDVTKLELRSSDIHGVREPTALGDPYDLPIPAGCVSRNPPYPGASIGQWPDKNLGKGALGTLTGYIRHGKDCFCLTCRHVLPHGIGSCAESPDPRQQSSLLRRILKKCPGLIPSTTFDKFRAYLASVIFSETSDMAFWRQVLDDIEKWNPVLGPVVCTSTEAKVGDFDWALVQLKPDQHQNIPQLNQHPPFNRHDASSGFQLRQDLLSDKFTNIDLTNAELYFHNGPSFKSIRPNAPGKLEICLKPPSRMTPEWRVGEISAIPTAVGGQPGAAGSYRYYDAIITSHGNAVFSKMGDSGSIVLDKNYRPFGLIQAGIEGIGRFDITHIVPLSNVLRNIEIVNGWELNSVEFCC
ncbi:hypothetical protein DL98DRAFT_541140 [Cadophora sp. DSE1049]|nr:hypothetical protein DL98DRAFT_541140 [Cadophora sp. DSE1049]